MKSQALSSLWATEGTGIPQWHDPILSAGSGPESRSPALSRLLCVCVVHACLSEFCVILIGALLSKRFGWDVWISPEHAITLRVCVWGRAGITGIDNQIIVTDTGVGNHPRTSCWTQQVCGPGELHSVNTHSVCSLGLWGVCLCALVLPCSTLAVLPVVMWASWTWKSVLQSLCVYCCECLDRILETPLSLAQWSLAPQRTAYCNLQYSLLFTVTFITFMHAGPDCAVIKSNSCDAGDNLTVFLYESELFPLIKQEWS